MAEPRVYTSKTERNAALGGCMVGFIFGAITMAGFILLAQHFYVVWH